MSVVNSSISLCFSSIYQSKFSAASTANGSALSLVGSGVVPVLINVLLSNHIKYICPLSDQTTY